jgi:hypothetical protein
MKEVLIYTFTFFLLSSNILFPQDDWKISGQIQLRSELDGRDFSNSTHPLTFASLRTRVGVEKTFMDKINFFVQIQDSRVFGEEANTLASIDNIDLHQGYVILKKLFDWEMDVQAGRFEVAYGTERFLGAVGWHYIGRAWDGVRFQIYPGFKLDLFALTHTESAAYISNAVPSAYPDSSSESTPSYSVYGLWESMNIAPGHQLDLFGYYEINREKAEGSNNIMLDRPTLGFNHLGTYGFFSTTVEGAYQFGKLFSWDVSAYLISLQASYNPGIFKIGAGADLISGSDNESFNSGEFNHFSPTFGTNHKFYGYMDYFINIPLNTLAQGLNDFYLFSSVTPAESKFSGFIDIHHFVSNTKAVITTIENPAGVEESVFGQEIDLTVKYNFIKGTTITWGGSAFIPGELMRLIFSPKGADVGFWSYIMITANI